MKNWPRCDCLIAFHSKGFPLEKTIRYARLTNPYIINDLEAQFDIQDRRMVYKILEDAGIEIPRYAILDRDSDDPSSKLLQILPIPSKSCLISIVSESTLVEHDDHIEVNGVIFNKPFVEKPVSAEDHNIYMYYPTSAGTILFSF